MTRAEKRYFKLYCSRHLPVGKGAHVELFDAIAGMAAYDEHALRKQFDGAAFMRRFPITKRRLYETILDSLDAFHAESSVDDKLRRQLHHVEILYSRALYADAAKVLHGVHAMARTHDRQAILLQVDEWERRLLERSNYSGISEVDLAERSAAVSSVLENWREVGQLWQVKSRSFLLVYRSGQAPGPEEMAALEALSQDPLLLDGATLHTPRARFLHHHVRGALAYVRNDLRACERELMACAEVLQRDVKKFQAEPDLMLGVMGNLAHVRMRLGHHQEALDGFREFRKLPLMLADAPSPDLRMKLFVMGSSLELSVLASKGEFNLAVERLANLEEGLAQYGGRASTVRRAELFLQAAYACFGAALHDRALRWCNRLLNEQGIEEHSEMHALGRILNLAVLLELGKAEHMDYVVRNTRRFHKQHGCSYNLESLLLNHSQALAKAKGAPMKYDLWARLAAAIGELAHDAREATVLDHIDLLTWAQCRAEDKTFGDQVKAKWNAQSRAGKLGGNKRAA
jgi:hypothetical protein